MADSRCDICMEPKPELSLTACTCGKKTCDECGRVVSTQRQHGAMLNAQVERWECADCEFGGGPSLND